MYLKYLIIFIFLLSLSNVQGQNPTPTIDTIAEQTLSDLSQMTPEQYKNFKLPPLQTLLENATKNPEILQSSANVAVAEYDLKLEKRKWLNYLSARAGYTYGILGTYVDRETELQPLTTTYSGSTQSSWSIGATLAIPINDLVNRGTSVKRQRKLLEYAQNNNELVKNTVKYAIIELYFNIQAQLTIIQAHIETLVLYNANYKLTENNFVNGRASSDDLSGMKREQKNSLEAYETSKAMINTMVSKLELLTHTQLINKKDNE